jgi:hypothetical protein
VSEVSDSDISDTSDTSDTVIHGDTEPLFDEDES